MEQVKAAGGITQEKVFHFLWRYLAQEFHRHVRPCRVYHRVYLSVFAKRVLERSFDGHAILQRKL